MKSYLFLDKERKVYGKVLDGRLYEMFFYNESLGNIYRAKVINKIDSINAYFVEYSKGKEAFLKSNKKFSIGDSVIGEIVRPASNNKLPLFSVNYKLETDKYILYRFPKNIRPELKESEEKSDDEYKYITKLKEQIELEENFNPTPKILFKKNTKDLYIKNNESLDCIEESIFQDSIINEAIKNIKRKKIYFEDVSFIIDELETLTVIDVNTSQSKSSQKEEKFFEKINKKILKELAYNLKLRNIGGMVLIDFLRGSNTEGLIEEFTKNLKYYELEHEIFGFTKMGLFELTIKRNGESLKSILKEKNII